MDVFWVLTLLLSMLKDIFLPLKWHPKTQNRVRKPLYFHTRHFSFFTAIGRRAMILSVSILAVGVKNNPPTTQMIKKRHRKESENHYTSTSRSLLFFMTILHGVLSVGIVSVGVKGHSSAARRQSKTQRNTRTPPGALYFRRTRSTLLENIQN